MIDFNVYPLTLGQAGYNTYPPASTVPAAGLFPGATLYPATDLLPS